MPSATSPTTGGSSPPSLAIRSRKLTHELAMKADLHNGSSHAVRHSSPASSSRAKGNSPSPEGRVSPKFEPYRAPKRAFMPPSGSTIAVVNASGRQAASFIRVASAVGYQVRAQLRNLDGIVANEIAALPNVKLFIGELFDAKTNDSNKNLIAEVFDGAHLAFINTTMYGDEFAIGCALADAASKEGVRHYIYSSMPDHSAHNPSWPNLPLWSVKAKVEEYVRTRLPELNSTFLYTGIYNNNFTSLHYPLFCMELQHDGSFTWQAPFHPDAKLPWLDAEHDVGPAVLQIFKDGVKRWGGRKVALAFELLSPREACDAFARGIGRNVRYVQGEIEVRVPIPNGYKKQLEALEKLYAIGAKDAAAQPAYFGDAELEARIPQQAMNLWEGHRGLEEYAREVFPLEEAANGLTWMNEEDEALIERGNDTDEEEEDDDDVLTIGWGKRREEDWLA